MKSLSHFTTDKIRFPVALAIGWLGFQDSVQGQIPPVASVDRFGIEKIYADAPQPANNWTFSGKADDARFVEDKIVVAGNGWFKPSKAAEMRVEVLSDAAANEKTIETFDVGKVLARGYLYKPSDSADGKGDFLNIEQTWRFKVIKTGTGTVNGSAHIELVPGGFKQTSSKAKVGKDRAVPASCETMSYHFNIYPMTGRVKFEKDSDHTTGYTKSDPEKEHAVPPFDNGHEIMQKAILYRTAKGMKLETYRSRGSFETSLRRNGGSLCAAPQPARSHFLPRAEKESTRSRRRGKRICEIACKSARREENRKITNDRPFMP